MKKLMVIVAVLCGMASADAAMPLRFCFWPIYPVFDPNYRGHELIILADREAATLDGHHIQAWRIQFAMRQDENGKPDDMIAIVGNTVFWGCVSGISTPWPESAE